MTSDQQSERFRKSWHNPPARMISSPNSKSETLTLFCGTPPKGGSMGRLSSTTTLKTVLNGSRLGKEFSANALERWFNNSEEKPMPLLPDVQPPENDTSRQSQQNSEQRTSDNSDAPPHRQSSSHSQRSQSRQPHSHTNDYDSTPSIPGLDLFQVGPGFNAEEEAFYREMQRRKKKNVADQNYDCEYNSKHLTQMILSKENRKATWEFGCQIPFPRHPPRRNYRVYSLSA